MKKILIILSTFLTLQSNISFSQEVKKEEKPRTPETQFLITTMITIFLAGVGYFAKYKNDVGIANRKDKLDRINRQLKEFYGPMLSLVSSSKAAWEKFKLIWGDSDNVSDAYMTSLPPATSDSEVSTNSEFTVWRFWMKTVFAPINDRLYEIIIRNGDLIIEDEFPQCLKDLCAHIETYRPVLKGWESNDFSQHFSLLNYPKDLDDYILNNYKRLKAEQNKLIK